MISVDDRRPGPAVPLHLNIAEHVLFGSGAPDAKLALVVVSAAGAERWSYGRLRAAVRATAGGLAEGFRPGARLLMRLGNTPDFPVVFLGAIAAGLVPVPTSAALGEDEITRLALRLGPDAVVAAPGVALPRIAAPVLGSSALAAGPPLAETVPTLAEAPAYIVFTSGTSAEPLGVVHAHRAILARGLMSAGWTGLGAEDRLLHAGAFNWTFTLGTGLLDPWRAGATALVPAPGTPPEMLALLARRHDATLIAGAPGIFRRLVKAGLPPLPRLRHGLVAGEKLAETIRQDWTEATGTDLHEAFGQSECSTFVSGAPGRSAPAGTLGHVQPGRAVAILGPEGPLPRGEVGEIAVHGSDPGLMLGYLDTATARLLRGEWFPTGDLGAMRDDGAIVYHGRADDLLTAGGFRVSALEVETAMLGHPCVEDAAAVDHRLSDDTTIIALHYVTGAPADEADLRAHAARVLARHKQPRLYIRAEALPRNANGKLLRKALRAANGGGS